MTENFFSNDDIINEFVRLGENCNNIDDIILIFKNFGLIRETQTRNGKRWFMKTDKKVNYKQITNALLELHDKQTLQTNGDD